MNNKTKQRLEKLILIIVICLILFICFIVFFQQNSSLPENLEQQARAFLLEKYNPGTCYGMPQIVRESDFIPKPKIEILQKNSTSFEYKVWDGHCCSITIYKGILTYLNNNFIDNFTSNETKQVPC